MRFEGSHLKPRGTLRPSTAPIRGLRAMATFISASTLGIVSAMVFGYAGGAIMATEAGRVSLATAITLLALATVLECVRMIAGSRRV